MCSWYLSALVLCACGNEFSQSAFRVDASFSVILEILSHEQWFTTPQFRYTILNVKCFPIIERSGFDSTRCASSAFYVFSVLCVLWLRNAAQKFYGDVDMWSVCVVSKASVCDHVPFCNLMHSTVWWCIWGLQLSSNPSNHFAFVHCRTKVRHMSCLR